MAAVDRFSNRSGGIDASGGDMFPITPDDNNELAVVTRGIIFDAEGALHVITLEDEERTWPSGLLAAQVIHPLRVKKVFSSGTTATNIHGVT